MGKMLIRNRRQTVAIETHDEKGLLHVRLIPTETDEAGRVTLNDLISRNPDFGSTFICGGDSLAFVINPTV